jgi:hypothetical protein
MFLQNFINNICGANNHFILWTTYNTRNSLSTIHHPMDSCWRLSFYVSTHLHSGKRIQREWKHMMIKRVIIKKQCSFLKVISLKLWIVQECDSMTMTMRQLHKTSIVWDIQPLHWQSYYQQQQLLQRLFLYLSINWRLFCNIFVWQQCITMVDICMSKICAKNTHTLNEWKSPVNSQDYTIWSIVLTS